MTVLQVYLFGGLMVGWDGTPMPPISGAAARSLFAYLLTFRDRPHTRDLLAGTFWPDLPDDVARRRLSQALWRIRKALDPHPVLLTEGDTVQSNPGLPLWLDVEQFTRYQAQCIDEGSRNESEALAHCESCLEQYRGEFLAGYYDDWLFPERERLRELYLDVLERLVGGYKRQGDYAAALAHARRLAAEDLLREEAHAEVMRLCHLLGRDAEALQQYETCRRVLMEELGVEPSPAIRALAREITERGRQAAQSDLPHVSPPSAALVLDAANLPELPLIGRDGERAEILAHVDALQQGLGGVVVLEGEAGVGKTRLLRAIAGDARWRGAEVLWGGGHPIEAVRAYGPLVEALSGGLSPLRARQLAQVVDPIWLQVLALLLPPLATALSDLPPPPLEPAQEQDRLANALAQLLAGWTKIVPLLMVMEDLHWAGQDSLELLTRLAPLLNESGVLVLGSYRTEEARARPAIWQGLQALDRAGVRQRMVLSGLSAAATGELVRRSLGMGSPAPLFEARLFDETAGNPLFLLETLRALYGEGLLVRDESGRWSTQDDWTSDQSGLPLPLAVEQIIARRLEILTPSLRGTLRLAAVLGERFDFDLLRAATGQDPSGLLPTLRELVQHRLLDETDQDYCFHHDMIRQVAYDEIDVADRPHLHRQAAEALELLQPEQVAALAHHWTVAEVWDRAARYHQQAGDLAAAVHANAEAESHYTRALQALEQLPGMPEPDWVFELYLAREAIYALSGDREAQARDLLTLETLADQLGDNERRAEVVERRGKCAQDTGDYPALIVEAQNLIELARKLQYGGIEAVGQRQWGTALWRQGKYEDALVRLRRALTLARSAGWSREEAASLYALAAVARHVASAAEAMDYGRQALAAYREIGDQQGEAALLNALGVIAHLDSDLASAIENYERALHTRRLIGDLPGQAVSLSNLGVIQQSLGDYALAQDYYQQSLHISHLTGDRLHQADTLGNLGLVLLQVGAYPQAQASLESSLGLYRDIGSRRGAGSRLADLAFLYHHLGQAGTSQECARQALGIAQDLGNRFREAEAWQALAAARMDLGDLTEAALAYQQAFDAFDDLGQSNYALDALAGLARASLALGDQAQGLSHVEGLLDHLGTGIVESSHEPLLIYLTCYRVLHAARDPRAQKVLGSAHSLLQERAARIPDEEMRRSYLEEVAAHREITAAYFASLALDQREVRLPRADAPTGRPLRDDEYATITWTVAAPEDGALDEGPARRQARLHRLLGEAADQGVVPTVGDLAAALEVSEPTVRRDLAALRRAGQPVQTRGSRDR